MYIPLSFYTQMSGFELCYLFWGLYMYHISKCIYKKQVKYYIRKTWVAFKWEFLPLIMHSKIGNWNSKSPKEE